MAGAAGVLGFSVRCLRIGIHERLHRRAFWRRLLRCIRRGRLPEPARQFEVRDRGKLFARVDLAYPDVRLAIEADGYRYHSGRVAWQRDLERRNSLTSLGWRVIHVTWNDVVSGGERVLVEIRQALGNPGQLHFEDRTGSSEPFLATRATEIVAGTAKNERQSVSPGRGLRREPGRGLPARPSLPPGRSR